MIRTFQSTCIQVEDLLAWMKTALTPIIGADKVPQIADSTCGARGERKIFETIDVDNTISIQDLAARFVVDQSRGNAMKFYAEDVVAAAVGAGELEGNNFWLYYTW